MTAQIKVPEFLSLMSPDIIPSIEGIAPPYLLHRYDKGSQRYYFRFPENGESIGYLSVTEFVKLSLGISFMLSKWRGDVGNKYAEYYSNMKAAQGTNMHVVFTKILLERKGNFEEIGKEAYSLACSLGYGHAALEWQSHIVEAVASFLTFIKEKQVRPISAEFPICSDEFMLGGCIDLPCSLIFNRKRVNAIVDYKIGNNFFESHELQLEVYKTLWNEWYSDICPITHLFNFSPSSSRDKTKPKYKLKNQTQNRFTQSVIQRMEIAKSEGWVNPPKNHFDITGTFDVETFDINNHVLISNI